MKHTFAGFANSCLLPFIVKCYDETNLSYTAPLLISSSPVVISYALFPINNTHLVNNTAACSPSVYFCLQTWLQYFKQCKC